MLCVHWGKGVTSQGWEYFTCYRPLSTDLYKAIFLKDSTKTIPIAISLFVLFSFAHPVLTIPIRLI